MLFPHLDSADARLRAIDARGAEQLRALLVREGAGPLPGPDLFAATRAAPSADAVAAQFLVHRPADGRIIGAVTLHGLDIGGRHVRAGVQVGADIAAEADATVLAVNYAFATWPLIKIYVWTESEKVPGFFDAPGLLTHEAVLREFLYDSGSLFDANIFAVYRENWDLLGGAALDHRIGAERPVRGGPDDRGKDDDRVDRGADGRGARADRR